MSDQAVDRGEAIDLGRNAGDPGAELSSVVPAPSLLADLDDEDVGPFDLDYDEDAGPIDAGNTVNVEPWGWVRGLDRWWIVPLDLRAKWVPLVVASSWLAASRAGMVIEAGASFTTEVALAWFRDDVDGLRSFACHYAPDPQVVAAEILDEMFEYTEPHCPCCSDDDWAVRVWVDEQLAPGVRDVALNAIWRPCTEHGDGCSFDNDGTIFTWSGERWVATD